MFALILWTKSRENSVISVKDISIKKDKTTKAKWGDKLYEAEVIQTNDNKDYLESLTVTTTGAILKPEKRLSVSPNLILAKRQHKAENMKNNALNKRIMHDQDKALLKSRSVYVPRSSSDSSSLSNEDDEKDKKYPQDKTLSKHKLIDETKSSSDDSSSEDNDKCKKTGEKSSGKQKLKFDEKKEDFLDLESGNLINEKIKDSIPLEDLENLHRLLQHAKSIKLPSSSKSFSHEDPDNDMELVPRSKVFVNRSKINTIYEIYRKKQRELARKLMKMIVGERELAEISATGKNWPAIPENIYSAVLRYINVDSDPKKKKKYKLDAAEYRIIITNLCSTLRNPKEDKKVKNSKIKSLKNSINNKEKGVGVDEERAKKIKNVYSKNDKKTIESKIDLLREKTEINGKNVKENEQEKTKQPTEQKENTNNINEEKNEHEGKDNKLDKNADLQYEKIKKEEMRKKLEQEYLKKLQELEKQFSVEQTEVDTLNSGRKRKLENLITSPKKMK